ncbi:type IX secretion system membrane protein PorP/SprF [Pedobacter sp. BS3]|uniref:PorP/SprF family type IX secretion system membrane protein n=1 Tax=Pedobacter sp. BS3 TaxID=2567937 RepID=UPI0011EBB123|nr:PorP/SprF family type IX secretion system membrane protein [Pedobacter sp. BS3]TZF82062.1 type IX secretion system membrane protein PorP/SprF [Pedobacter sp. BS3]
MKKITYIIVFLVAGIFSATAQIDPHLSQYYIYPSWLNPALTGAFDGDFRISGVYRNQWNNIADGFSTAGLSADMVTSKNLNFGVGVMQQTSGTGYRYLTANASASYSGLKFDAEGYKRLVFGIQAGVISRKFDSSKFQFGDQWNSAVGYDPTTGSLDGFQDLSSSMLDIGAGAVYYDADPGKKANVFLGFSASHLTRPEDSFTSGSSKQKLPIRYTLHGGVKLNLSGFISIVPNALYLRQGNAEEKMVGGYVEMNGPANTDILLGANYRFQDAIVPFAGLNIKNLVIGVSYDVNNSDLRKYISNANSMEVSLSYIIRRSKTLGEKHFICPRL